MSEADLLIQGFWKEWRGSFDGRPSMLVRTLFSRWGYRVDLHKFIRADDPTCFHTHPAHALRIILWGGYVEELRTELPPYDAQYYEHKKRRAGYVGVVRPELCHRVHKLLNGKSSYSLWFRGRKSAEVSIFGEC